MKLHEAIITVLNENKNEQMSYQSIADRINELKLYQRKIDNNPLPAYQVYLRTKVSKNYKNLFSIQNEMVSLAKA